MNIMAARDSRMLVAKSNKHGTHVAQQQHHPNSAYRCAREEHKASRGGKRVGEATKMGECHTEVVVSLEGHSRFFLMIPAGEQKFWYRSGMLLLSVNCEIIFAGETVHLSLRMSGRRKAGTTTVPSLQSNASVSIDGFAIAPSSSNGGGGVIAPQARGAALWATLGGGQRAGARGGAGW